MDSPIEKKIINYQSNTLENFTTIISGEEGVDAITADKLVKINENKTMLIGNTNLKNDKYEITSKNVTIDSHNKITSSVNKTKTVNSLGTVNSEGFEFDQETNTIKFNGESTFYTNED